MASSYDDDIDWEAAVKEIDDACERAALASTAEEPVRANLNEVRDSDIGKKKVHAFPKLKSSSSARQSTIKDFVGTNKKLGNVGESSRSKTVDSAENGNVCVDIDPEVAKTWIYPVNVPLRDYQFSMVKTALFANTLVVLPTGLGKTLVAAVVMYNYFRWFSKGKIVFAAPSRPLVMQQIEACHNIVGIPQEWTIDMTGQMKPAKRSNFWETKRVFFVTPQVLEKDIQSGRCLVKQFVCLVVDEAHRAMGNYSYCTAVRELMAVPVQARILALTATPGSKQHTVQSVIDNLHISVLEYRNESDHDVRKYMQKRQLELMEVPLGNDAVKINDLLLEAIRPFVSRLSMLGVLQNRDLSTFSPCSLLDSREKFRQSPPLNLPQENYGEVEGYFTVLISLYYIRKLLSSHGIRPAYEMLNEKMQQGTFSKLVCRNGALWNAKLLMQQSLSHGAPNPKLLKMLEVLTDHFKTNDPEKSRVIIFSNYRGSVRDIMESLSHLGEIVKATQFVGQSSGKSLKGQSQKVQQAVLQKFRTGAYNVIVATSIGEEGLDIMEVDLVICFDANVSPLRMIQRMGRTGRKHQGRVVVLACEGSELKGYLSKQTKAKAVGKHMHNGGTSSFHFHPSPRMVPHMYKPEVQFVELSIEKFVPRGRKAKDNSASNIPTLDLSFAETELLAKYFHSPKEEKWKPSLIAFPHFQVFPSGIYQVRHSYRTTTMLVDSMQFLQEMTLGKANPGAVHEVSTIVPCGEAGPVAGADTIEDESMRCNGPGCSAFSETKVDVQTAARKGLQCDLQHCMPGFSTKKVTVHHFLFASNFVSITDVGSVFISYVPVLPFSKGTASCTDSLLEKDWKTKILNQDDTLEGLSLVERSQHEGHEDVEIDEVNVVCQTPTSPDAQHHESLVSSKECMPGTLVSESKAVARLGEVAVDKCKLVPSNSDIKDMELSPRLTNFVKKGIVPETPIAESFHKYSDYSAALDVYDLSIRYKSFSMNDPSAYLNRSSVPKCSAQLFNHLVDVQYQAPSSDKLEEDKPRIMDLGSRSMENLNVQNSAGISESHDATIYDQSGGDCTPVEKDTSKSCSEEWQLPTGDTSNSVQQPRKLKRLHRYGGNVFPSRIMSRELNKVGTSLCRDSELAKPAVTKFVTGRRNSKSCINNFIDEEAEVSSDVNVSEDEQEDCEDPQSNSFIDDGVSPTAAATQAEEMLAFYRRSLLTQSPMENFLGCCNDTSFPMVTGSYSHTVGTYSCEKSSDASPRLVAQSSSTDRVAMEPEEGTTSVNAPRTGAGTVLRTQTEGKMVTRKRKLIYQQVPPLHAADNSRGCEDLQFRTTGTALVGDKVVPDNDTNFDDEFYESLDLDEIEAKATEMLRHRSPMPMAHHPTQTVSSSTKKEQNDLDVCCSPSFDLGV